MSKTVVNNATVNNATVSKKRIDLGVNTKDVKVQFNTSTKGFRDTMGKYWVAVVELADMTKIYANNVKILSESVATLEERTELGTITDNEKARLKADKSLLEEYSKKFVAFRDEMNDRFEECYGLITDGLYTSYHAYATSQDKNSFKKSLGLFLKGYNINVTDSLVEFLLSVVGMRKAPANTKVKSKGATLLIAQTEKCFNELFMHALAQLMVDKNCIKTDNYTFTYEKASTTHIYSKIDNIEVKEEQTEEEVAVPQEEEVVDYATMTTSELKALAKDKGVKGYSKMKKSELITILAVAVEE